RDSSVVADTLAYLRVLRAGRVLGITPDVLLPPDKGLPVWMFGHQVTLSPGAVLLAMRAGAPLVTPLAEWLDAGPGGRGAPPRLRLRRAGGVPRGRRPRAPPPRRPPGVVPPHRGLPAPRAGELDVLAGQALGARTGRARREVCLNLHKRSHQKDSR